MCTARLYSAGVGQYGFWFRAHNATIDWRGFDGAENVESFTGGAVKWIDVTDPLFDSIDQHPDWVMSLECGEHIPPEATDAFIDLCASFLGYIPRGPVTHRHVGRHDTMPLACN